MSSDKYPKPFLVEEGKELTDDELAILIREGNREAFSILLSRYSPMVLGYATRFLNDRVLARDVCQDVFITIWQERESYDPRGKFKNYLMTIARFRAHKAARLRRNRGKKADKARQRDALPQNSDESPLEQLVVEAQRREVQHQLRELRKTTRHVLILRFHNDLTMAEIAEMTGKPLGTIKTHVSRGLKELGRLLRRGGT